MLTNLLQNILIGSKERAQLADGWGEGAIRQIQETGLINYQEEVM